MHGSEKVGNFGNLGQLNSTPAIGGTPQTTMGAQPGQGTSTGTIVWELSAPVVVSHSLLLMDASEMIWIETPLGTVVIVEVTIGADGSVPAGTGMTVVVAEVGELLMYSELLV